MAEIPILVTRPEGQAEKLGQLLREAGFAPVSCPMMVIEAFPVPNPEQVALIRELDQVQHLIFVSANAVRCAMDWIAPVWPALPDSLSVYAVGPASAELLGEYGVKASFPESDMSSEGLLKLPSLSQVEGERVVIARGEGGRTRLREELVRRGAQVEELASYRRSAPGMGAGEFIALIQANGCQAIMLSSGEGLDNMVSLLCEDERPAVFALPVVVPGPRVADLARDRGFQHIIEADNASDQSMLVALSKSQASWGKE